MAALGAAAADPSRGGRARGGHRCGSQLPRPAGNLHDGHRGRGAGAFELVEAGAGRLVFSLDQFDLVAIRIGNKRNHGAAALDGARFAGDVAAVGAHGFAGSVNIVGGNGDVAVGRAHFVFRFAVVVGQL